MQKVIDVHIGQLKIARNGELLQAILGSCVGIGLIWPEKKICGLAHCLLPKNPNASFEIGARFVDQALRSLTAMMKILPCHAGEVSAVIVGGGNMMYPGEDGSQFIGAKNFESAFREVQRHNLKIVLSDVGGNEGRKVFIDGSDFSFRVEKIPRIIKAS